MASLDGLLGLAARGRALVSGDDACMRAIRTRKAVLVIVARDAGANGVKKLRDKCSYYNIPLVNTLTKGQLGRALGKDERVVVAVTDARFAAKIAQVVKESVGGEDI
ncbi:MAG: L7Ae/L30e/S12e/Gadd45 family ribosomal protein [Bacilli bacterium]